MGEGCVRGVSLSGRSDVLLGRDGALTAAGLRAGVIRGNMLYMAGAYNNTFLAADLSARQLTLHTRLVGAYPFAVALGARHAYVCCADTDSLEKVALSSGQTEISTVLPGYPSGFALLRGKCLVCTQNTALLYQLDQESLRPVRVCELPLIPMSVAADEACGLVYVCGIRRDFDVAGCVCALDETLTLRARTQTAELPIALALWGGWLAVSCSAAGQVALYRRGTLAPMGMIDVGGMTDQLCPLPRRGVLLVGDQLEGRVSVLSVSGRKKLFTLETGKEPSAILSLPPGLPGPGGSAFQ